MKDKGIQFPLKVLICVLTIELLGGASGLLTSQSIGGWYADLNKPAGNPPNWVFGPGWTALYAMIGVSFALVWQRGFGGREGRIALTLFLVQMALNLAWTPVFFGLHWMFTALVVILLLWVAILSTIFAFGKRSTAAAGLLVPYLIWVGYASYLNAAYWFLNRA